MRRLIMCGAAVLTLGAAACGDDDGTGIVRVAALALGPDSARTGAVLLVGDTLPLTVTPKDASGNTLLGRTVSYFSSSNAVATVTNDGRIVGVGEGSATITASVDNRNVTAPVTVIKPYTLTSVNGAPLPVTIPGQPGQPPLVLNNGAVALYTNNGKYFIRLRYTAGQPAIDYGTYATGAGGAVTFTSAVDQMAFQGTLSGNLLTFRFGTETWIFTK